MTDKDKKMLKFVLKKKVALQVKERLIISDMKVDTL